jgi:hypothetical protein
VPESDNLSARPSAANGFAWLAGSWDIVNRRRNAGGVWEVFVATSTVTMAVEDLVQLDHFDCPHFPGRGHVRAITIRAYDAATDRWSLTWLSNYASPDLRPLVGSWDGDQGHFFQTIEDSNQNPLDIRFRWTYFDDDHARWEQAISDDGGKTWDWEWTMEMTRRA